MNRNPIKGIFGSYPTILQLILLMLTSFAISGVLYLAGAGVVRMVFGIDLFNNPEFLQDLSSIRENTGAYKILLLFQHLGMFVIPGCIFPYLLGKGTKDFLSLDGKRIGISFFGGTLVLMIILFPLSNWLAELNSSLELPSFLSSMEETMEQWEDRARKMTESLLAVDSIQGLMVNLILVAIIPAVGEELIFRGNVQRLLTRMTGSVHAGIWIGAILFSTMHFQFYGFLPRLALGGLFGYLLVWSGSIWVPILAHLINNGLAVVVMYLVNIDQIPASVDEQGAKEGQTWVVLFSAAMVAWILWALYSKASRTWRSDYLKGV